MLADAAVYLRRAVRSLPVTADRDTLVVAVDIAAGQAQVGYKADTVYVHGGIRL